jgi:hypothetical protein
MQAIGICDEQRYRRDFFDGVPAQERLLRRVKEAAESGGWPSARHWVAADAARADELTAIHRVCSVVCLSVALSKMQLARASLLTKAKALSLAPEQVPTSCVRLLTGCFRGSR